MFAAKFPGTCNDCQDKFESGTMVKFAGNIQRADKVVPVYSHVNKCTFATPQERYAALEDAIDGNDASHEVEFDDYAAQVFAAFAFKNSAQGQLAEAYADMNQLDRAAMSWPISDEQINAAWKRIHSAKERVQEEAAAWTSL